MPHSPSRVLQAERPVDREVDRPPVALRAAGIAVLALPAVPVIVSAIRLILAGWVPTGDEATIALRSFDVFSARSPLLGQATTSVDPAAGIARTAGPLQYWFLSVPSHLGPVWLSIVAAAALSIACLCGAVALARRQGGLSLATAVSVGLVLVVRAANPDFFVTTWNPNLGLAPFVLLFFLCWVVGSGGFRWFPLMILAASFAAQCHMTYLVSALPLAAVASVAGFGEWLWAARRRSARTWGIEAKSLVAGVTVLVLCWAPTFWQQVAGPGKGNLRLLAGSGGSDVPRLGYGVGWRAIAHAIAWPPRFLSVFSFSDNYLFDVALGVSLARRIVAGVLVAVLLILGALALRRRDRATVVGVALVGVLIGAGMTVGALTPGDLRGFTTLYTLRWLVPLSLEFWAILGFGVARWWQARRAIRPTEQSAERTTEPLIAPSWAVATMSVAIVVALIVGARTSSFNLGRGTYRQARQFGDAAADVTEPGRRYAVQSTAFNDFDDFGFREAVAYNVRRAGGEPVLDTFGGGVIGQDYVPTGQRCAARIRIELDPVDQPPPKRRSGRVLSAVKVKGRTLTLVELPEGNRPSC